MWNSNWTGHPSVYLLNLVILAEMPTDFLEKEGSRQSILIPETFSFAFGVWVLILPGQGPSLCWPTGDGMTGKICPRPCERQWDLLRVILPRVTASASPSSTPWLYSSVSCYVCALHLSHNWGGKRECLLLTHQDSEKAGVVISMFAMRSGQPGGWRGDPKLPGLGPLRFCSSWEKQSEGWTTGVSSRTAGPCPYCSQLQPFLVA